MRSRLFAAAALAALALALAGCGDSPDDRGSAGDQPVIEEYSIPNPPGKPHGSTHELTLGPDGNVWVTQQKQDRLVRITPGGDQSYFPMPDGSGPHGIDFDRAGHLWLTWEFANAIVELDQHGHVLERYRTPDHASGPHGLDVAADGRVWWTGKEGNGIGRLDPSTGDIETFPLPARDEPRLNQPIYIAEGCDGNMYFTELNSSRMGRVDAAGKLTEYPIPEHGQTGGARPIAVARAPEDCGIWVSEEAGEGFGVLDPDTSKLTEFPTPGDQLAALAFDESGTLWIQTSSPDVIGRVGKDGSVEYFRIPTSNATMHRIILGPDGNMWFTELAADKVGYITTR